MPDYPGGAPGGGPGATAGPDLRALPGSSMIEVVVGPATAAMSDQEAAALLYALVG